MVLFGNKQESNLRSCIKMVEEAIEVLGHPPDETRLETQDDMPAWRINKGSAYVYVMLFALGERNFIRIIAPVINVRPGTDETRLFRRLLELNAGEVTGATFGLKDGNVVLSAERTTVDLDRSEVLDLVQRTQDYADHFDDLLVKEFGGRMAGLSAAPVK